MKVLDLSSYRQNKNLAANTFSRQPLYSNHLDAPKKEVPELKLRRDNEDDFGLRMQRIRESLWRINQLMHELRESSTEYTR